MARLLMLALWLLAGVAAAQTVVTNDAFRACVQTVMEARGMDAERIGDYVLAERNKDGSIAITWLQPGVLSLTETEINTAAPRAEPPQNVPAGIEVPVLVLESVTNGIAYGLIADDAGNPVTYLDHASPRPDGETIRQRQLDAVATNGLLRADLRALKVDVAATIDGLQTNVTATVFSGAERQEFRDLVQYTIDLAQEVKRLRRVVGQMQRDE